MGCSRLLFFMYVALIQLVIPTSAQYCYNTGNYTSNSTYKANLDSLLASIINDTEIDYGFFNFSTGESPDKVYAIALCRGDTSPSVCRSCINGTRNDLLRSCPNRKEAIIWGETCSLRYSFRSIFNIMEARPLIAAANTQNFSDVEGFNDVLRPLLDSLRNRAASGNSTHKFALKSVAAPKFQTIYSLVECTPDLSELDCSSCLQQLQDYIPQCCDGKQGVRFVTPSCDLRYEIYPFYASSAEPPPSPPPSSPPPPPLVPSASPPPDLPTSTPGKESNSSRTVIIVVATTIASAVLIISISICIYLRARNPVDKVEIDTDDQISVVECLQFDFGKIRVATQDFSDANKLGEGGFGAVYKGRFPNGQEIAVKRLFQLDQTQENTNRIVGTYGYMPPEYLLHGQFSVKSDVFSFGVLVLEMVTGQKNNTFRGEDNGEGLLNYAWKKWKDGTTSNLIDPTLRTDSTTEIMKCIHIGLLCVQENMVKRPTMASVVLMLNSESMTLSIPSRPAFTMDCNTRSSVLHVEHNSGVMGSTQSRSSSVQASVNDVSITELDPR
ncbi:hypothetical protein CMV_008802 [Castanea mollissima]|uniref:Gnk2-homologous domain-containing protein n=1 Tax=Castanea mollissima TaxID=60419 RepID=A0A8J4R800_9ROSI|nr:hypothetical protein CMV_008802 [Castanea mollissima]